MIGIIIDIERKTNPLVYHRIHDKPVVEYVIETCLKSNYSHKVIVSAPELDNIYITGSTFKKPVFDTQLEYLGRKPFYFFYGKETDKLERIHRAALLHGIDTVVLVQPDCPLIPLWFLSEVTLAYLKGQMDSYVHTTRLTTSSVSNEFYNDGLCIEIWPFWLLANGVLYCNYANKDSYVESMSTPYHFKNISESDHYIYNIEKSLKFTALEQLELMEPLLKEVSLGADLGDLMLEFTHE